MHSVTHKLLQFLADERGSIFLEYALVSTVSGIMSFGIGFFLRSAQAQSAEAFVLAYDEMLAEALTTP